MQYKVRFSVKHGGSALTYREVGHNTTEYICCYAGFEAIRHALKSVGLPLEIAYDGVNGTVYEVTGKQLRDLGFAIEDNTEIRRAIN
jgi:hypothetical protein